jgi:hypothetical protein
MTKYSCFLLIAILIIACNRSSPKKTESEVKGMSDSASVTFKKFKEDCVVFIMPDSSKLSKMRKEQTEDNYNEVIADIQWYIGIASECLDSLKIKNSTESDCRLIFIQQNGKKFEFNTGNIDGNMILFRNDTIPKVSYAINFKKDSILKYFKK